MPAPGMVCDSCRQMIYDRNRGKDVDEDHPAVQAFDRELEKYGIDPSVQPKNANANQSGCAILLIAAAAIPTAIAALGLLNWIA